jgi:epimerase transport system membrane fusion protein|tara:strand:+ start:2448 stop:3770 length:1323 start_codon:yes stop_codon:yes gene_type:complete
VNTVIEKAPADKPSGVETSMEDPKRVGLIIFFLVFGVFGVWASIAPLGSFANAPGTVNVRSYSQVVQHLEGGIISDIKVQNGDMVNAGQPLLEIDNTQSLAQLEIVNSQFVALKAREARLVAERDQLNQVGFPESLDEGDTNARQEMAAQTSIFNSQRASRESTIEVFQQRIGQLQSKLDGLGSLKSAKEELTASFAEELEDVRELLNQGFADKTRLRELERNVASLKGDAAELAASVSSTEIQIGETRLQIIVTEQEFQNDVVNQLGETQTSLKDSSERIYALQDIVSRTIVRAPAAGIVSGMQFHTIRGVVAPGTPIANIVPQSEEFIVDAQVSPTDIDRVAIGMDATIRFSAFGSAVPTIFGEVVNLSADRIIDENTGVPYYLARVVVTDEGKSNLGDLILLPGMPAEVFINTGSRTFMQYLFKPFSNALARSFIED